jgi:hypothetical protein
MRYTCGRMPLRGYELVAQLLGCLWSVSMAGAASRIAPISELQMQPDAGRKPLHVPTDKVLTLRSHFRALATSQPCLGLRLGVSHKRLTTVSPERSALDTPCKMDPVQNDKIDDPNMLYLSNPGVVESSLFKTYSKSSDNGVTGDTAQCER